MVATRILPLADDAAYLVFDNFPGTSSTLNGKMPVTGSTAWVTSGAANTLVVSGGGLMTQSSNAANPGYAIMNLGATPGEIGCTFETSTSNAPTIACYTTDFTANMFHFFMNSTDFNWSYWKNGTGTIFPTDSGGDTGGYTLTPGQVYTYRVFLEAPYVHGLLQNAAGDVIYLKTAYDANIASVIGPTVFWETFDTGLIYHSVWARPTTTESLSVRRFFGGLDGTPIGLRKQAPARFRNAHVGIGSSAGTLSVRYDGQDSNKPTIRSAGVSELHVKSEGGGGYTSQLRVEAGNGATARFAIEGDYATKIYSQSGSASLTFPANDGNPYFIYGMRVRGSGGPMVEAGSGTPEGNLSAPIGSIYMRTDGGASTSLYVKESGTGNTGWVAK